MCSADVKSSSGLLDFFFKFLRTAQDLVDQYLCVLSYLGLMIVNIQDGEYMNIRST